VRDSEDRLFETRLSDFEMGRFSLRNRTLLNNRNARDVIAFPTVTFRRRRTVARNRFCDRKLHAPTFSL